MLALVLQCADILLQLLQESLLLLQAYNKHTAHKGHKQTMMGSEPQQVLLAQAAHAAASLHKLC